MTTNVFLQILQKKEIHVDYVIIQTAMTWLEGDGSPGCHSDELTYL